MSSVENAFQVSLLISAFFVTICFSIVLIFYIVVMPGIAMLDNGDFLRAFQVIDGIIQSNQPMFMLVSVGTFPAMFTTLGSGISQVDGTAERVLLILSMVTFLTAQASTFIVNIPRNNRVENLQIPTLDSFALKTEREHFEETWNRANLFRTVLFGISSVCLLTLLLLTEST